MSNILIEANNISKVYDPDILLKRGKNIYALNNVNFELQKGDFISIMGPSGSGKSTLLNCLSTLDQPTSGHIQIFGKHLSKLHQNDLCEFRFQKLGFVFQNHNLIPYLSIFDNIAAPLILGHQQNQEIEKRIHELAKMLEIEKILDKFPHECSGGECQRTAIARALVNQPEILFCDEPTGNLDSKNSHKLMTFLSQLNQQETTIVLVTHDSMIASYGKTMMYLYDGGIKTVIHRNQATQKQFLEQINEIIHRDTLLFEFDQTQPQLQSSSHQIEVQDQDIAFVSRQTVYMVMEGIKSDENILKNSTPLFIQGTQISYKNKRNDLIQFDLQDIQKIRMDLSAHFVNFGLFSQYVFHILLDCVSSKGVYQLKLKNRDDFIYFIHYFHQLHIPIDDPRHIEETYQKYPDDYSRQKYYQRTHKDLISYKS